MLKRFVAGIFLVWLAISLIATRGYAFEVHENPATAEVKYSGISLLLYYSGSLDNILAKDPQAAEALLGKMPFVNIPAQLDKPTQDFASSGIALSYSLADLFAFWDQENSLVNQYRLDEADILGRQIAAGLPGAYTQLAQLKGSAQATGSFLAVGSIEAGSGLNRAYDEVSAKIQRLSDMLDLLSRPLSVNSSLLKAVRLTLDVNTAQAFVGDVVDINGLLSSSGESLGSRQIEILLNGSSYLTVTSDAQGAYQARLQIPFWYSPDLKVQAIYFPQGADIGRYLGSSSPAIQMAVLYYEAEFTIKTGNLAYPGQSATITGNFDYGQTPSIDREGTELYLDDTLISRFTPSQTFAQEFLLPTDMVPGKHTAVVSVPAAGRYAPLNAACILEVTLAATNLDSFFPSVGIIPGTLKISGNVHSSFGPLQNADVNIDINDTRLQATSSPAGSFTSQIQMPMSLSLFGSQKVTLRVQPQEPWNATLSVTRSIIIVNFISCGILLVILVLLSIYLPRRLRKWLLTSSVRSPVPVEAILPPASPVNERKPVAAAFKIIEPASDSSPDSIFNWYRIVLKLIQALTRAVLKPHQTLREYALQNSRALGPAGPYFFEFTLLIEKLIYSNHRPGTADIEQSRQLSHQIQEEVKDENI